MQDLCVQMCDPDLELEPWLVQEQDLLHKLLALLDPSKETPNVTLSNLHQLLDEIVQRCRKQAMEKNQEYSSTPTPPSALLACILREDSVETILSHTFCDYHPSLEHGLEILLTLVSEPQRMEDEPEPTERDRMRHQEGASSLYLCVE